MEQNTQSKIFDFLKLVETQVPVHKWSVNGENVWPMIRSTLAFELILIEDFDVQSSQVLKYRSMVSKAMIVLKTSFSLIKYYFSDFSKNDICDGKTDVLFLINSSTRFFKVDGKFYNPYSDTFFPFLDKNNLKQRVLELTSDFQLRMPRYRKSKLIQLRFFILQFIALIKSKGKKFEIERFEGFDKLNDLLRTSFVKYKKLDVVGVNRRLHLFNEYKTYFLHKLKVWQPKVMVCHGYYSPDVMALISACNELGIKTIEVQHGVQGDYHIAYCNWSNVPEKGYDMFPNVFWTWGETERDRINNWLKEVEGHEAVQGGNPCVYIFDENGNDASAEIHEKIKVIIQQRKAEKNIIFTVQAFFELPEFLLEAIVATPHWNWWMRIHPQYTETKGGIIAKFKELGCENVLVDEATDFPLGVLLRSMDVHATEFSSSVLEALNFEVPSVVISDRGINIYSDLINKGFVKHASTTQELVSAVEGFSKSQNINPTKSYELFVKAIKTEIIDVAQ